MNEVKSPAYFFIGWLCLLTLLPFLLIFGISFCHRGEFGSLEWVFTLENYSRCFQWLYAKVLIRTLSLAFTATFTCLLIGFPVAYFLARAQNRLRTIGLVLIFVPFWTNFILRIFGIISLVGNHGLLNLALHQLGLGPVDILYSRLGVQIGLTYNYLPFVVIPIFSALEKLDPSFREAAADLGANRFETFWRVVLPNVKEGIFVGSLFVFIPMMGEYVIPDLLGGAKETFLGNLMVGQFFTMQDWPFGSAIAGLLSLLLLLILWSLGRKNTLEKFA